MIERVLTYTAMIATALCIAEFLVRYRERGKDKW